MTGPPDLYPISDMFDCASRVDPASVADGGRRMGLSTINPPKAEYVLRKPGLLRRLYDWCIAAADKPYATWLMGTVSFVESSFFPLPC